MCRRHFLAGLACVAFYIGGCSTRPALSLEHQVDVPKEFRSGNFSADHPGYSGGNSTVERYVEAYERGWALPVEKFANDIDFSDPSPFVVSGRGEEASGGGAGYADGCSRIRGLIDVYGKPRVLAYLHQFLPLFEPGDSAQSPEDPSAPAGTSTEQDR